MSKIRYTSAGTNKWGLVQGEQIEYEFSNVRTSNLAARLQALAGLLIIAAIVIFIVVKF